jgi:carbon-monoxide dehydrogenase large subunit
VRGEPWKKLDLKEVVMGYSYPNGNSIGGPVVGYGKYIATELTNLDPDTGQGNPTVFETFGCQGVEVEVDVLTGRVELLKAVSAFDVGRVINPQLADGQVSGGTVMASSLALLEQLIYKDGVIMNPHFLDYKIARMSDAPKEMVSIFVENPQENGPYGARGLGELTMIGIPAAIGNAISKAVGVEMKNLPMTPESVWKAISQQNPGLLERAKEALRRG